MTGRKGQIFLKIFDLGRQSGCYKSLEFTESSGRKLKGQQSPACSGQMSLLASGRGLAVAGGEWYLPESSSQPQGKAKGGFYPQAKGRKPLDEKVWGLSSASSRAWCSRWTSVRQSPRTDRNNVK